MAALRLSVIVLLGNLISWPAFAVDVTQPPYNAVCDQRADDTATIQAALTAITIEVVVPRTCRLTTALRIMNPTVVRCVGRSVSGFILSNPTADGIDIETDFPVEMRDCGITSPNGQTAGAMISVTGQTQSNRESVFERLRLVGAYVGFDFVAAAYWTMDDVHVLGWGLYGAHIRNTYIADEGDSLITGSLFFQGQPGQPLSSGGTAIFQETSGGLKIQGTKILGGDFGYMGVLPAGVFASDLLITGSSIENQANTGILLMGGSSSAWYNVVITGNELEAAHYPIVVGTSGGTWLHGLTITGNVVNIMQAGGQGITVEGADGFTVAANTIRNFSGGGYGIVVLPHSSNGEVLQNAYNWLAVPIANMSSSTRVVP